MTNRWRELFPDGRTIFYEGNDPESFRFEIKARFGFDVRDLPSKWPGDGNPSAATVTWDHDRAFFCPAEFLDVIYSGSKYPMGS